MQGGLPLPQRRCTLNFAKDRDAEVSKSLVKYLDVFVTDTAQDGQHYLCKQCFAQSDKARCGLEALETSINTLRAEIFLVWYQQHSEGMRTVKDRVPQEP